MILPSVPGGTIPGMGDDPCVKCGEAPSVDGGLCAHCFWAVEAEIAEGWYGLLEWLKPHNAFADWCSKNGRGL